MIKNREVGEVSCRNVELMVDIQEEVINTLIYISRRHVDQGQMIEVVC